MLRPLRRTPHQRKRRGLHGEVAIFKNDSLIGGGLGKLFDSRTGDRIENQARAFAAGI